MLDPKRPSAINTKEESHPKGRLFARRARDMAMSPVRLAVRLFSPRAQPSRYFSSPKNASAAASPTKVPASKISARPAMRESRDAAASAVEGRDGVLMQSRDDARPAERTLTQAATGPTRRRKCAPQTCLGGNSFRSCKSDARSARRDGLLLELQACGL